MIKMDIKYTYTHTSLGKMTKRKKCQNNYSMIVSDLFPFLYLKIFLQ